MRRILRDKPSGVGFGGANLLAESVMMDVVCVSRSRKIWLRISPGRLRYGEAIEVVD